MLTAFVYKYCENSLIEIHSENLGFLILLNLKLNLQNRPNHSIVEYVGLQVGPDCCVRAQPDLGRTIGGERWLQRQPHSAQLFIPFRHNSLSVLPH